MEKEFKLSEKIGKMKIHNDKEEYQGMIDFIQIKDVKEFIKKLKEEFQITGIWRFESTEIIDKIDKLAGEELTNK